jgi:hypothetical protein
MPSSAHRKVFSGDVGDGHERERFGGLLIAGRNGGASNGTVGDSLYARPWYVPRNSGVGPDFYGFDMRLTKALYLNRDRGLKIEAIVEGKNLLNHTNFSSVNDQFAVGDPFLLSGPFNVSGNKNLSPAEPLGFTSAYAGRQVQFGLKLAW